MRRRVDIDGGDPKNDIEEALRQFTQRQRPPETDGELDRAVQEVADRQRAAGAAMPRRRTGSPWPARVAWIGLAVVVVALIVAAVLLTRPEPLPPPATTADGAVRGFWTQLIGGRYEGATAYYPSMVTTYGTRQQAATHLREVFQSNPPANLRSVGAPEPIPDYPDSRVTYEVYMRSGLPRTGEFTVRDTGTSTGFIIVTGGW